MCSALLSSKHSRLFIPGIILMIVLFSLVIVVFRCTSHWTSRTRVLAYTGLILPFMVIVRYLVDFIFLNGFQNDFLLDVFWKVVHLSRLLMNFKLFESSTEILLILKTLLMLLNKSTLLTVMILFFQLRVLIFFLNPHLWLVTSKTIQMSRDFFISFKYLYLWNIITNLFIFKSSLNVFFEHFLFDFCCLNYNLCCLIHFILNYFSFSNNLTIQRSFYCW